LREDKLTETHKILETWVISEDKIMLLRSFKEIRGIEMTKRSRLLFKITWLMMKKEKMKDHIKKFTILGDTSTSPHLTQSAYEESLMNNQLNELSKGEKTKEKSKQVQLEV
jgi:hypothetical protein